MLENIKDHFIVCGYGRIGSIVAGQFRRQNVPYVVGLGTASELARQMVMRFGMSDEIGLMRMFATDSSAYLGEETPLSDVASETKADGDRAVRRLLQEAELEAEVLLEHHRSLLDDFSTVLATEETLEGVILQQHLDSLQGKMRPPARGRVRAKGVGEPSKGALDRAKSLNGTSPRTRRRSSTSG